MKHVPYVYYLRFPLIGSSTMAALGPLSFFAAPSLLRGIFDLSQSGLAGTVFLSGVAVFAFTLATMIVLENAGERFWAAALPEDMERTVYVFCGQRLSRLGRRFFRFYAICGLILCAFAVEGCRLRGGWLQALSGAALGVAFALGMAFLFRRTWQWLGEYVLTMPAGYVLGSWQGYLERAPSASGEELWQPERPFRLRTGHGLAGVFLVLYLIAYAVYLFHLLPDRVWPAATLTSLLTLITLLCWLLSGLAFAVDRFRIPVIAPVVLLLLFGAQWPGSDHTFPTVAVEKPSVAVSPGHVVGSSQEPVVIVCASGGGIQAGAWAAAVLDGLETAFAARPIPFSRMVKLISSVSGGSVGTMYYGHAFEGGRYRSGQNVVEASMSSSLDYAAHGLVYPDMVRSVLPVSSRMDDRARLVERAWSAQIPNGKRSVTLGEWRDEVRDGLRPAHVFNTTVVETGERMLIATVDLAKVPGRSDFYDTYAAYRRDLLPVTAARLSATFPYVTPVARIDRPVRVGLRYHLADGGYYDNSGVVSALDFLTEAFPKDRPANGRKVLLLQIRGAERRPAPASGDRGWFYQLFAPLTTLERMRDASQGGRNSKEVEMLGEVLAARGVDFKLVTMAYTDPEAPLSWHLLESQKQAIRETWRSYATRGSGPVCDIAAFLYGKGCEP